MVLGILDYQICCDKPSEEIHIAVLYVAWYIFQYLPQTIHQLVSDLLQVGGFLRVFGSLHQ
jgi:hypothetical protein